MKRHSLLNKLSNLNYLYYDHDIEFNFKGITDSECINFIRKYFSDGDKDSLLYSDIYLKERAVHSTITFFLSILFTDKLLNKESLKIKLNIIEKSYEINHLLFLICLYHDYNFIENIDEEIDEKGLYTNLICLSDHFKEPYTINTIKKYYNYKKSKNKIDHGIKAGLILFNLIKSKLDNMIEGYNTNNRIIWSYDYINLYKYISSIIIKHNIWFANKISDKDKVHEYDSYGLDSLIIDDDSRVCFTDDELLYIFFIIDTLEPTKIFKTARNNNQEYSRLLNNIRIRFLSKKKIVVRYSNINEEEFQNAFNKAAIMEYWMKIKIHCKTNRSFKSIFLEIL